MPSDGSSPALTTVCVTARLVLGAAAASVARVVEDGLRYEASDGAGAEDIVGVTLEPGRGLAGYVAATGQSLAVSDVTRDPRFARDVAERTGYVPSDVLLVPVTDGTGEAVGVLSVLDRATDHAVGDADALRVASALAGLTAHLMASPDDEPDDLAELGQRLDRLDPDARRSALAAIVALLDALGS